MEYNRSRYEKILDENTGLVKEIFIAVSLFEMADGVRKWEQGYWLTEAERDAVVADEAALTPIVAQVAAKGEVAYANYLANPPVEDPEVVVS